MILRMVRRNTSVLDFENISLLYQKYFKSIWKIFLFKFYYKFSTQILLEFLKKRKSSPSLWFKLPY